MSRAALPGAWDETARIRREVSATLVDAALAGGASRYIQESLAFFYRDMGDRWIDEDVALELPSYARSVADAEAAVGRFTAAGRVGIALRFGLFYGPANHMSAGTVGLVRNGIAPFVGPGAFVSSVALDDAAAAVRAALNAPAGAYNVVDDEPVTHAEFVASVAAAAGVSPPRVLPAAVAAVAGRAGAMSRSQRVSNRRFRDATGWAPRFPSVREGWPAFISSFPPAAPPRPHLLARLLLLLLAAAYVVQGGWALFAPRAFYDGFPGFGRHWVAADGPFNEHLVGDVGALTLALAAVLVAGALSRRPGLVRLAAAAALVFGVPHLLYHATHLGVFTGADAAATLVALGLGVAAPVVVIVLTFGRRRGPG